MPSVVLHHSMLQHTASRARSCTRQHSFAARKGVMTAILPRVRLSNTRNTWFSVLSFLQLYDAPVTKTETTIICRPGTSPSPECFVFERNNTDETCRTSQLTPMKYPNWRDPGWMQSIHGTFRTMLSARETFHSERLWLKTVQQQNISRMLRTFETFQAFRLWWKQTQSLNIYSIL